MSQDLLALVHRFSRGVAAHLGPLRPLARRAFRTVLELRYGERTLMHATQNGRTWRLLPEVALRGAFAEFETIEWFREVVRPGMSVVDVGANVGQMTLELGYLVGAKGRVIAVEPGPGNLEVLRTHVTANAMEDRVTVVNAACTDSHGGALRLFVAGSDAQAVGSGHTIVGKTGLHRQNVHDIHELEVPAVTLDALCAELHVLPSVVKIDVEGAELHVLRGMRRLLAEDRPAVRVAFHPFAFEDAKAAGTALRQIFLDANYELRAPAQGALELAEYVAMPRASGR